MQNTKLMIVKMVGTVYIVTTRLQRPDEGMKFAELSGHGIDKISMQNFRGESSSKMRNWTARKPVGG
jgi:hypothetical protein